MIDTVRLLNFKALRDNTISKLGRLTLFIGPNSAGKTSVLQAVHYVSQVATTDPEDVFTGTHDMAALRSNGATDEVCMELAGSWDGVRGSLALWASGSKKVRSGSDWEYKVDREWGTKRQTLQRAEQGQANRISKGGTELLDEVLASTAILRLDASKMALAAYSDDEVPVVAPDGSGLAAVLAHWSLEKPDHFARLQECLRAVIPAVKRLRIGRAGVRMTEPDSPVSSGRGSKQPERSLVERSFMGNRIIFDMVGATDVPAHAVSEGTLLALGLLTVLSESSHPRLLLIDDLERALHPRALGPMVAQLRQLLDQNPTLQVMATSHSPFLVDELQYDEIRLITTRDDGSAVCGSLQDHPDFDRWKALMLPGEFWSMHAESWLKDKRPT